MFRASAIIFTVAFLTIADVYAENFNGKPYRQTNHSATMPFVELADEVVSIEVMKVATQEICEYRKLCTVVFWTRGAAPESRQITKDEYMSRVAQWKVSRFENPDATGRWEVNCKQHKDLKKPLKAKCLKFKWNNR